jgi:hypothetical protein
MFLHNLLNVLVQIANKMGLQNKYSPDINPLDFYMWGYSKSFVYLSPADDVETVRNRIVVDFQTIRNISGIWDGLQVAM